jgi:hypothetical protein
MRLLPMNVPNFKLSEEDFPNSDTAHQIMDFTAGTVTVPECAFVVTSLNSRLLR